MGLLPIGKTAPQPDWFPTRWQAVIFRNWGKISPERIAKVLKTDQETVTREAERLGLDGIEFLPEWRKRGYLTIIRENWQILSYEQLLMLLDVDEQTLEKWLYQEDFLYVKLGRFKPAVCEPIFIPLTPEQLKRTECIAAIVRSQEFRYLEKPFDFESRFKKLSRPAKQFARGEEQVVHRIVHAYLGGTGDLLDLDIETCFSDRYLDAVASRGITGLFIHAVLEQLSRFPFCPERSEGYERRRKILAGLVKKFARHGLKLWLYFNEPRGLPIAFFDAHPELLGEVDELDSMGALCTSLPQVQDYLRNAICQLFQAVPDLGGIITITMSENLTNCFSHKFGRPLTCPRCQKRSCTEVLAEVNTLIWQGIKAAGSAAELVVWNWAWNDYSRLTDADREQILESLPKGVCAMSNSEEWVSVRVGETEYPIVDYTVSQSARAPGEYTRKFFAACDRVGLKKFAKIQLNTSWECCAVPFIPVFETNHRHIDNLLACGLDGLVLGWTLGGYPSPNMEYFATRYRSECPSYEEWISATYSGDAGRITRATKLFSDAFEKFPFTVSLLYNSPVNVGVANPFYVKPTKMTATMVGYPYDDLDSWIYPFLPEDVIVRFEEMCEGMDAALAEVDEVRNDRAVEWKECAEVLYCNMKSTLNQMKFHLSTNSDMRRRLVEAEWELTERTLKLMLGNCTFGFEASNHYYWDINILLEKLVCLKMFLL